MAKNKSYKLTESEVQDLLKRATESYAMLKEQQPEKYTSSNFSKYAWDINSHGAYNPMTTNTTLKSLNIHTLVADKEKVDAALKNPIDNEDILIGFNQYFYFSNMQYKQAIDQMVAMPAFDLSIRCINIDDPDTDYKSKEYKADSKKVKDFLQKFDYRAEFSKILLNLLMSETSYIMFRKFKKKYKLQEFPFEYAILTGDWEYGLTYDIDVSYFMNNQVDIDLFPDTVKEKINKVYNINKQTRYDPSNTIAKRDGSFANYIQTSPEEGFIAFKFNTAHNLNVPYFSASLAEVVLLPILRALQQDQSMAAAKKIVAADVPFIQNIKGAGISNQTAISSTELAKFVDVVANGLQGIIKLLYTPTQHSTGIEFNNTDKDSYNMFTSVVSQIISGGTSDVSTTSRENMLTTQIALNMKQLILENIYPQFNDFLNYYVNNETEKFKFEFRFTGCKDKFDREKRQKEAITLAGKGMPSLNMIATSYGLNKYELEDDLDEYNASGIADKLQVLLNENTMKSKTEELGGRPKKETDQLTDSGAETRNTGSNIEKVGFIQG